MTAGASCTGCLCHALPLQVSLQTHVHHWSSIPNPVVVLVYTAFQNHRAPAPAQLVGRQLHSHALPQLSMHRQCMHHNPSPGLPHMTIAFRSLRKLLLVYMCTLQRNAAAYYGGQVSTLWQHACHSACVWSLDQPHSGDKKGLLHDHAPPICPSCCLRSLRSAHPCCHD